jgi:hypothetical protein
MFLSQTLTHSFYRAHHFAVCSSLNFSLGSAFFHPFIISFGITYFHPFIISFGITFRYVSSEDLSIMKLQAECVNDILIPFSNALTRSFSFTLIGSF